MAYWARGGSAGAAGVPGADEDDENAPYLLHFGGTSASAASGAFKRGGGSGSSVHDAGAAHGGAGVWDGYTRGSAAAAADAAAANASARVASLLGGASPAKPTWGRGGLAAAPLGRPSQQSHLQPRSSSRSQGLLVALLSLVTLLLLGRDLVAGGSASPPPRDSHVGYADPEELVAAVRRVQTRHEGGARRDLAAPAPPVQQLAPLPPSAATSPSSTGSTAPAAAAAAPQPPVQKTLVPPDEPTVVVAESPPPPPPDPAAETMPHPQTLLHRIAPGSGPLPPPPPAPKQGLGARLNSALVAAGGKLAAGLRRMRGSKRAIAIPTPIPGPHDVIVPEEPARAALASVLARFWPDKEPAGGPLVPHHAHSPTEGDAVHPADILVGTFYSPTGKFAAFPRAGGCDYGAYLHANRWRYASIHGYQYDIGTEVLDATRPLPWQKVLWTMRWLRRAKWVLVIDADALLVGLDKSLEPLIDHNFDFIMTKDGNNFNSGVVLFKSSPTTFRFLKAAYMKMHNLNSPWWEQQSFIELLAEQPYASRVKVVPQKELNSYPPGLLGEIGWWAPGDRVLHFPGTKGEDFSNAVSLAPDVRYAAAFPRCMAGHEHSAWERAAPGPPPEGAAEGVDAGPTPAVAPPAAPVAGGVGGGAAAVG